MIELGATAVDKITGFQGVVTGYVRYITGCNQALLTPKIGADGRHIDSMWVDEQRLDVAPGSIIRLDNGLTPGFDKAPPRR